MFHYLKQRSHMKALQYTVVLFLCVFGMIACREDASVSKLLTNAEALMEESPDSALILLQQIETPEKQSDRQYALWCLLFTQAQDKNYIQPASDSLIQKAVSYFEEKEEAANLMKSYYYMASVYQDMGDSFRAQEYYLKALEMGKKGDDYALLGRTYANLSIIYTYQDLLVPALDFGKSAIGCFSMVKDSINTGITLQNIGRIYTKNNQPDSAITYYRQALSYLTMQHHRTIYNELAGIYMQKEEYGNAFENITMALALPASEERRTILYYTLGDLYRLTDQRDSAYYYLSQSVQSNNIYTAAGSYLNLAYLEEQQKDWSAYAAYLKEYLHLQDSINKISQTENLQRIQSQYNYQQIEKERVFHSQASSKKTIYLYRLSAIFIVIVGLLIAMIFRYQKKKHMDEERHERALRIQQQKNRRAQDYLYEKEERIRKLEASLSSTKANQKVIKSKPEQFYSSPIYRKLSEPDGRISKQEWDELETWINILYPDFTERLQILLPTIDITDLKLSYLKKINIPVKYIANILSLTSQGVSLKWKRLYKKITGEKESTSKMDDFIAHF